MLDARATQYNTTPAALMGLEARSPDPVEAWAAHAVNEACYLAGGRREAEENDRHSHNKGLLFHNRTLPLRR